MAAFALCSYLILGVGSLVTRTPVCLFFGQGYLATFVPKRKPFSSSRKKSLIYFFRITKMVTPFFLRNSHPNHPRSFNQRIPAAPHFLAPKNHGPTWSEAPDWHLQGPVHEDHHEGQPDGLHVGNPMVNDGFNNG